MARFLIAFTAAAIGVALANPAQASGNPAKGASVFRGQCGACHTTSDHGPQTIGPRLAGVVGRHAGSVPGYSYSPAMKASRLVWSQEELREYLAAPGKVVHGTKMPYAGLHNPDQLDDLIAFLATQR